MVKLNIPTESEEQKSVVQYCRLKSIPIVASLNGVQLGTNKFAVINHQKAMGLALGFPDLFIPVPRGIFHGMFIEMKRQKGGSVSDEQMFWLSTLTGMDYWSMVACGATEAIESIDKYMKLHQNWGKK